MSRIDANEPLLRSWLALFEDKSVGGCSGIMESQSVASELSTLLGAIAIQKNVRDPNHHSF